MEKFIKRYAKSLAYTTSYYDSSNIIALYNRIATATIAVYLLYILLVMKVALKLSPQGLDQAMVNPCLGCGLVV